MLRERKFYHPIGIMQDLVRKNMFELVIGSSNNTEYESLRIMCKTLTIQLPKSNPVQVNWMGGIMQLAGRISTAYQFTATFLVGTHENSDALSKLYTWRNRVFDHDTGQINLAPGYKEYCYINVYDVTGGNWLSKVSGNIKYRYGVEGLWPTDIQDLQLSVEDDAPLEISVTFAADKLYKLSSTYTPSNDKTPAKEPSDITISTETA